MTVFAYKAMDPDGRIVHGEADALNIVDLEMRLKRLNLDLIVGKTARRRLIPAFNVVPVRERIHFCFHLEQLLSAGVPVVEALTDLRDSTPHHFMREVIARLVESIEGGRSLSQAMSDHPSVFDPVFCALVRAGESTGNLSEVLNQISASLKRQDELGAYLRKLTIYPSIVMGVTFLAVSVAMAYVVPELTKLFRSSAVALPLHTRVLVGISAFVVNFGLYIFAAATMAFAITAALVTNSPSAAHWWDRTKLTMPLFGTVYRKIILSRFASLFAMMYASGISIMDTIHTAQDVVGNRAIRGALVRIESLIAEGQNVTEAFSAVGLFPPLVVRMLRIGEHTGSLDQALKNVSYFYERDVRESIERLQAMLEPLLILVLGIVMLWVAVSVLGPIYDVITKMKV